MIPDILRYIAMLDYTRQDTRPWFWQRLASSLRTAAPQSAILQPFDVGAEYPPISPFGTTSDYPSQSYPWPQFDLLEPVPAPEPPVSPPMAEDHFELLPAASSQFFDAQLFDSHQSEDQTSPPTRRSSARHHHSSGIKLKSYFKSKKK